jgi:peroxiredoxin
VRVLVILLALAACRHEPVLNPNKQKDRGKAIEKEQLVAPASTVQTIEGQPFDLATLWADKRVVVIFYRGHWCPHCKHQLGELEKRRVEIGNAGATIVAISSDAPPDTAALRKSMGVGFDLYSDPQLAVINSWGVADHQNQISLPATFVVEPGGKISFRHVGEKPTDQPPIDEVVDAVKR